MLRHNHEFSNPFTSEEIIEAISVIKVGKAAGLDYIHPEFIKNCGPKAIEWLRCFFNDILKTKNVPSFFKKTKIIAILKPGKKADAAENFRPISLLCILYKLLERLLYKRISPKILDKIPVEQGGFRPKRNTIDQVLALTTHIEAGFQRNLKTGLALIDLTAAYDTVWRHGVLYKLIKIIQCDTLYTLMNNMLSNRYIYVYLDDNVSRQRTLNDGLPQGAVLSCLLFLLYIGDVPGTYCRKFIFADDLALVFQAKSFLELEIALTRDLDVMRNFFEKWRLRPNPGKTVVSAFHLWNQQAWRKLNVLFDGVVLEHEFFPMYLGIILDRALTFKRNSQRIVEKVKPRNNILRKLAGTTWGADTKVLRTTALALVYSVAEYGAPVWLKSTHTQGIDIALNESLRVITGSVTSTPIEWLNVLAHIEPPEIRRTKAFLRQWEKQLDMPELPIHLDLNELPDQRLPSRKPPWITFNEILLPFQPDREWQNIWQRASVRYNELVIDPSIQPIGFNLPRKAWVRLNRIRTGHGNCAHCLHLWNLANSPICDCGASDQTMSHIVNECPIRKFSGGIMGLNELVNGALEWLNNVDLSL